MADNAQDIIEAKAQVTARLQQKTAEAISELTKQQALIDAEWETVKNLMIENDVKSIKGEWGNLTIVERINWDTDPTVLAPKFFKKVVDTAKLTTTFKLEGKEPNGATAKYTKFLMKRIKQ